MGWNYHYVPVFSAAQTKLPNYIYLVFPFFSILMAEWLLLSTKRWAKILPLLSIGLLVIVLGYSLQIYDISGADRLLLNATFIILCIPTLLFSIAILKNRDSKTALFIYAFTCFWSIYFLTHVTLPRVSHYDDIKKVVTVILMMRIANLFQL